jgi:formylglycine-generating enzyme
MRQCAHNLLIYSLSLLFVFISLNPASVCAYEYTLRVAVLQLHLHNTELSEEDNLILTDAIRLGLQRTPELNVVTHQHLNALIDPRLERSAGNEQRAIDLGKESGADWVIMGRVTQMGRTKRVTLKVLEEPLGRLLAQHMTWAQSIDELADQLEEAGSRLAVKSLFTLTKKADELEEKTEEEILEDEKKAKKEKALSAKEKAALALSAAAQKELDDIQKSLDEAYRLRKERTDRKRLALESDARNDWREIEELLGTGLKSLQDVMVESNDTTQKSQNNDPVLMQWSDVKRLVSNPNQMPLKQQKKILLAFIDHYKRVAKFHSHVREAQNRFTWINRTGVQWTTVRGGRFLIGSAFPIPDEWPIQWISIQTFQTSISEVTNAQYKQCVDAGACTPPHWDDAKCHIYQDKILKYAKLPAAYRRGDMPVVCVSWQQATRFASWTGGRLLSEAEWEFTARSGERSYIYPWGTEEASCKRIVMAIEFKSGCGFNMPWPVCSKPDGSNSYGMCDLAGNVWEWVIDRYRPSHEKVPTDGSPVTGGGKKVIRGGSYASSFREVRASTRGQLNPNRFASYIGFRVARDYVE